MTKWGIQPGIHQGKLVRHTEFQLKNSRISKDKIIFRALNPTSNRALLYSSDWLSRSQTVTYRTYITAIKRFIATAEEEVIMEHNE